MARTHVVMDDEVLREIDEIAGRRGRSRFLEEAAREKIVRLRLQQAVHDTAGAVGPGPPEWEDRDSIAEWVRTTRRTETAL